MKTLLISVLLILTCALSAQEEYSISNRRAIGQFEMAKRYYILRNYENSVDKLMEALRVEPEFIEAWLLLGQVQTDAYNIEESVEAYQRAVDIDPLFFPNALFFLAENEMALGMYLILM